MRYTKFEVGDVFCCSFIAFNKTYGHYIRDFQILITEKYIQNNIEYYRAVDISKHAYIVPNLIVLDKEKLNNFLEIYKAKKLFVY
jgi:hypothetical protein